MAREVQESLPGTAEALERGIEEGHHLGAQLYVSLGGRPVVDSAVGENRPGEPLTRDHLALWLSSTKPVTAVALAQLWERGELHLDDPVARFLPEFEQGGKGPITLRHVLTHTGGFRMLGVGWPQASWEEILAKVCALPLEPRWIPGEKAGYHLASSWFVLGEVIRRIDGRPFERYVREEVFEPLGLDDCWIGMTPERFGAYGGRIAVWWNTEVSPPRPHPWHGELWVTRPSPGGNGRGPMRELGRFYEALLGGGRLAEARVLSEPAVEALTARHRCGMLDHTFKHVLDWGLGFILNSRRDDDPDVPYGYGTLASRRTFGHSGYRSSTGFADPEHGLVVALAMNGTPSDEDHERRIHSVLDALYRDLDLPAAGRR